MPSSLVGPIIALLQVMLSVLTGANTASSTDAQRQAAIDSMTAYTQTLHSYMTTAGISINSDGTVNIPHGTSTIPTPSPSPEACHALDHNLSVGQSGDDVRVLQTELNNDGEDVQVTGTFDDKTAAAVTAFQEKYADDILKPNNLLHGTGFVGAATREKLNTLFALTCNTTIPTIQTTTTQSDSASTTISTPITQSQTVTANTQDSGLFGKVYIVPCDTTQSSCPTNPGAYPGIQALVSVYKFTDASVIITKDTLPFATFIGTYNADANGFHISLPPGFYSVCVYSKFCIGQPLTVYPGSFVNASISIPPQH